MKRIVLLLIASIALGGCKYSNLTSTPSRSTEQTKEENKEEISKILTVVFEEQSNSTQVGVATIQEVGNELKIMIAVKSLGDTPQPAHIHAGNCKTPEAIKYPLTNVVNGESETMIDTDMASLLKNGELIVNIHKSAKESGVYTACGAIK